jgi:hypothetical protein
VAGLLLSPYTSPSVRVAIQAIVGYISTHVSLSRYGLRYKGIELGLYYENRVLATKMGSPPKDINGGLANFGRQTRRPTILTSRHGCAPKMADDDHSDAVAFVQGVDD